MDNQRLILFFALLFVLFLMWEAWQEDYGPKPTTVAATQTETAAARVPEDLPSGQNVATAPSSPEMRATAPSMTDTPAAALPEAAKPRSGAEILSSGERIKVVTDVLEVVIDTQGGDIRKVFLHDYPVAVDQPENPFRLMKDTLPNLFVAQSGLLADGAAPDHYATYQTAKLDYTLDAGQNELRVPLTWQSDNGIRVTKTLIFYRNSHVVDVEHKIENNSGERWKGNQYRQLQRTRPDGSGESAFIYTYTGGVLYSEDEKYEKIDFDDMEESNLSREITDGWAAMIQHYFLGAIIPAQGESNQYYTRAPGEDRFVLGMVSPAKVIETGSFDSFSTRFYIGPKEQEVLSELAPELDLTVDYGMLTVIAKPLFWVLDIFHGWVANWGWAIIMVTLVIKLIFYPLSAASYRSMANMRKLTPKLQQIKERYGDDRQRMSQAMMELYKKEKINPLGGCLPMLVQIPVFIALYWVLLESVELRQAPFILWIEDLSIKDPYYVLPLLMGASMFIQQKLNPPPPDPVQAKIMMALPFIFTLFFAFFPAGLVLYWVANSILSIAQQWYVTVKVEKAADAAKAAAKAK